MTSPNNLMGLLDALGQIDQIIQSEGCSPEIAWEKWQDAMKEQLEDNVIYVDFRARASRDDDGDLSA
jgi:hypothetical protein